MHVQNSFQSNKGFFMKHIVSYFFTFVFSVSSLSLLTGCAKSKKKEPLKNHKKTTFQLRTTSTTPLSPSSKPLQKKRPTESTQTEHHGVLLDQIVCRVNGANIMESDLHKPRIDKDGTTCSLDELIAEELLWQKATELKCIPTPQEIDHRLTSIKQINGMLNASEEEFQAWLLNEARLTIKDLQQQLMRIGASSHVKQWNAQEQSVVSEKEKRDFYQATPFFTNTEYHLQVSYLDPENGAAPVEIDPAKVDWTDVGWIAEQDLSDAMSEIKTLAINELTTPLPLDNKYQIVQLLDKKERKQKSYEESEALIEKKLLRKKQKVSDKLLIAKLRERASIIFLKK